VSNFEFGKVTGTGKFILTEGNTRTGLITAAFEANISLGVGDEGQFTQRFFEENGAIFTVAVEEGVGSIDDTVVESIDWLIEGPSTADDVEGSIRSSI
jgi:hypothetical protein